MDKTNEIIKRGYKKMPNASIKQNSNTQKTFVAFKYPLDDLREPKDGLFDSMAVCEYTYYNMGKIGAYVRSVFEKRFPERKFALRKQKVKNIERVVVYRTK